EGIYTFTLILDKNSDELARNLRQVAGKFVIDALYNGAKVREEFIAGKEFAIYTSLPEPTITIS
ncbi:MAG: hypothetical protein ACQXXF_07430, partial [Thermoplasmatota archaeon]